MLHGHKVFLRPLSYADLPILSSFSNDLLKAQEVPFQALFHEVTLQKEFSEHGFWQQDAGIVAISSQANEKIVGILWYKRSTTFSAFDLNYLIFLEEDRNQGYMSEALQLFSTYLFASREIPRLQVFIPDYHRSSMAVAQKCGFSFEGIARKALFLRGKYVDLCLYSLLREDEM